MADKTPGGPQATDLFSLGGDFQAQSSTNDDQESVIHALDGNGDVVASDTHGSMNSVSCVYKYTGAATLWTTTTSELIPKPGSIQNSYIVTSVQVDYSPTDWPTVTITGHNHDENAHSADLETFSPSITLAGARGCPDLWTNADTDSAPTSVTYTIACEHVDVDDGSGDHLAGDTYRGMETISAEYVGTPSLTTTGWYVSSSNAGDSNTEFDTTAVSGEKPITRD